MKHDALLGQDWLDIVGKLGGADALAAGARKARAFIRPREVQSAEDLLRLVLAYCLGDRGLRLTVAWAAAMGLVDISNPALLYRLRQCGDWLALLIGEALQASAPAPSHGRLIRIIDGTAVPKAGRDAKRRNALWRVHAVFDLPSERFGGFELTDQHGVERLDRMDVVRGEIRIADGAYLHPHRIAEVLEGGGDVVIRAGWRNARWLDQNGKAFDMLSALRDPSSHRIDRPIWVARKGADALPLRLVAVRKSADAAETSRRKARHQAHKEGYTLSDGGLAAADWHILVTSLPAATFPTEDVLALYRLRWRIELAFKRLKSLVGLKGPPGKHERSARPYILAHLLTIVLLDPLTDALEDSPPAASTA